MDFYTAFQRFTAHTPAWVLILGLVMCGILTIFFTGENRMIPGNPGMKNVIARDAPEK